MKIVKKRIHISDFLDEQIKKLNKSPSILYITLEDLAELKEYLGLDFLDELNVYHNCKIITNEKIKETIFK